MILNGKTIELAQPVPVTELLQQYNFDIPVIAVELNGEIVPRCKFGEILLQNEDIMEVVSFVCGG